MNGSGRRLNMNRNVILTAKDLSKTFSNASQQQHVLKNLNLEIRQGDPSSSTC